MIDVLTSVKFVATVLIVLFLVALWLDVLRLFWQLTGSSVIIFTAAIFMWGVWRE